MAGGLVGLFDDVAALAKLAASSIDDVGAAAGRASMKAAGVVVAWCRQGERGRNEAMDSQASQGQPSKPSQDWMGYPGLDWIPKMA